MTISEERTPVDMISIWSVAGFGVTVNLTLIGREFVTPDSATVPTNSCVLPQGQLNVAVYVPVAFAPGVNVIVKVAESVTEIGIGLMVNTPDPSVILMFIISGRLAPEPYAVQVWDCELPGEAVNNVGPPTPSMQAVAFRLTKNVEHSRIKKAATLETEIG